MNGTRKFYIYFFIIIILIYIIKDNKPDIITNEYIVVDKIPNSNSVVIKNDIFEMSIIEVDESSYKNYNINDKILINNNLIDNDIYVSIHNNEVNVRYKILEKDDNNIFIIENDIDKNVILKVDDNIYNQFNINDYIYISKSINWFNDKIKN